jgi:hypothetical protein
VREVTHEPPIALANVPGFLQNAAAQSDSATTLRPLQHGQRANRRMIDIVCHHRFAQILSSCRLRLNA